MYTKITTISPLYVIINQTDKLIIVVQEEMKGVTFIIKPSDRVPFHWANKLAGKYVCIKSDND